jgi:hypothetical protein
MSNVLRLGHSYTLAAETFAAKSFMELICVLIIPYSGGLVGFHGEGISQGIHISAALPHDKPWSTLDEIVAIDEANDEGVWP